AQDSAGTGAAVPEPGLLGRREEAHRDPADGDAEAAHRRPRRDRLRPRHRRAACDRGRCSSARRAGDGGAGDHALPADPQPHQAGFRARLRRWTYRGGRRSRAGAQARGQGLQGVRGGCRLMAITETEVVRGIGSDYEIKYGFHADENYFFKSGRGLSHELVDAISSHKDEPAWMRKFRHRSLDYFEARPLPQWGGNLNDIDFANIFYYIRPTEKQASSWEELPSEIKDTWDKLGIPEAEKK